MHAKERDIALFIENSLKPEKRRKIEQHLTVCGSCRRRLRQWEDLYDTVELLDYDFQLDGLEEKVIDKIKSMSSNAEPVKNVLKFPALYTA
ncbi:MAG TPA: zf-HC2 domain-containing protein, partial [Clostridia bacterium]